MFFVSSVNSVPSTTILPSWCSSNLLIHRINVDFPDPDGPQTTIYSFGLTSKFIPFKTWKSPNHLFILRTWIILSDINLYLSVLYFCSRL